MTIAARLQRVRQAIQQACATTGRAAESITLVAVSKKQPLPAVIAAYEAGVRDFGENTAQELVRKATALAASGRRARWHFLGRLQTNKCASILPHVCCIQSVDRLALVEALAKRCGPGPLPLLLQVNIGDEPQKGGVAPAAALGLAEVIGRCPGLQLRGLMAVPPAGVDARPYFEHLRDLFLQLRRMPYGEDATELSMGMSQDYPLAIACGATMVRVGSAIFGERHHEELA